VIIGNAGAVMLTAAAVAAFQPSGPLDLEARVQSLVHAMTNEEKARQLDMYSGRDFLSNGRFNKSKADLVLGSGLGVGRIHDLYAQDPALANEIQRAVVASSRHGEVRVSRGRQPYSGQKLVTRSSWLGLGLGVRG